MWQNNLTTSDNKNMGFSMKKKATFFWFFWTWIWRQMPTAVLFTTGNSNIQVKEQTDHGVPKEILLSHESQKNPRPQEHNAHG